MAKCKITISPNFVFECEDLDEYSNAADLNLSLSEEIKQAFETLGLQCQGSILVELDEDSLQEDIEALNEAKTEDEDEDED